MKISQFLIAFIAAAFVTDANAVELKFAHVYEILSSVACGGRTSGGTLRGTHQWSPYDESFPGVFVGERSRSE